MKYIFLSISFMVIAYANPSMCSYQSLTYGQISYCEATARGYGAAVGLSAFSKFGKQAHFMTNEEIEDYCGGRLKDEIFYNTHFAKYYLYECANKLGYRFK